MCVYEGVEKPSVRFYEAFIFILHVQKFSFSFRRAIRGIFGGCFGQYLTLAIMCYKKGRCRNTQSDVQKL